MPPQIKINIKIYIFQRIYPYKSDYLYAISSLVSFFFLLFTFYSFNFIFSPSFYRILFWRLIFVWFYCFFLLLYLPTFLPHLCFCFVFFAFLFFSLLILLLLLLLLYQKYALHGLKTLMAVIISLVTVSSH